MHVEREPRGRRRPRRAPPARSVDLAQRVAVRLLIGGTVVTLTAVGTYFIAKAESKRLRKVSPSTPPFVT